MVKGGIFIVDRREHRQWLLEESRAERERCRLNVASRPVRVPARERRIVEIENRENTVRTAAARILRIAGL